LPDFSIPVSFEDSVLRNIFHAKAQRRQAAKAQRRKGERRKGAKAQRRRHNKGAKKTLRNAAALGVFAPLREKTSFA
jgi:hypothetical protein